MKCEEHRTIALISHASKILLRILLNRIQKTANEQIADVQMGFRKAVGTRDQIFILRVIMEKANEASVPYIWHLYKKAFDTVKHNKLWTVLKRMGLSGSTVDTLQSLYEGQQAAVRVDYRLVHDWQRSSSRVPYLTFVIQLLLGPLWLPTVIRLTNSYFPHYNTVRSTLHTNFFHLIAILHMAPDPVPITIISYKNSPASMNVIICFVCYVNTVSRLAYRTFYIIMYATLLQ